MKLIFLGSFLFIAGLAQGQQSDQASIKALLNKQTESWNKGDLEGFMATYWHNDSLMFIGKNGIKWGWKTTLDNYKKSYPDTLAMGQLFFNIIQVKKLSTQYAYVVGKWYLKRSIGDLSGHYDLLLRKIKGNWVIIADHSS